MARLKRTHRLVFLERYINLHTESKPKKWNIYYENHEHFQDMWNFKKYKNGFLCLYQL